MVLGKGYPPPVPAAGVAAACRVASTASQRDTSLAGHMLARRSSVPVVPRVQLRWGAGDHVEGLHHVEGVHTCLARPRDLLQSPCSHEHRCIRCMFTRQAHRDGLSSQQ